MKFIKYWFAQIESRGKDATGYATLCDDGRLFYRKNAGNATKFVAETEFDSVPIGRIGLLHTRAWTVGSPSNNANNHPVIVGKTIVTHNGGFYNLEQAYKELNVTPIAEVDSAIVPHAIHERGYRGAMEFLVQHVPGTAAIAALLSNKNLLLAKDSKPLYFGKLPQGGFMWSSEDEPCYATTSFNIEKFDFAKVGRLPEYTWVLIDGKNLSVLDRGEFKLGDIPAGAQQRFFHSAQMGGGTSRGSNRTICAWGRCLATGMKDAMDTDGKVKKLCKEHKKKWQRNVPIPKYRDEA